MTRYVELTRNGPTARSVESVPADSPWPPQYTKAGGRDAYASIYQFTDDLPAYVQQHGGRSRGYRGPCVAHGVHFDFDGVTALDETRDFVRRLLSDVSLGLGCDDLLTWFSGRKGFHLYIRMPALAERGFREDTPEVVKGLALRLAGEYRAFDTSVYDRLRIVRVANSQHGRTKLYKVGIDLDTLLSYDMPSIRALAQQPLTLVECAKRRARENLSWAGAS